MLPTYLPRQQYNGLLDQDSYKCSMHLFYRDDVRSVYSFLESRGGENAEIMMAGTQPLLYDKIAQPMEQWQIEEAQEFSAKHFGVDSYFNREMADRIMSKHDGMLPLRIRALDEGLIVPKRTPMVTFETTDLHPTMKALTTFKETMMMRGIWPACSIASRVFRMKKRILPFYTETSANPISPFAILDFSSRGVFGEDHSKIAGAAFTFMFQGSDNIPGIRHANYYYFHDMAAYSVAAMEHSIASGWVRDDDGYIDNCLAKAQSGQILSMVGDTWNIYEFAKKLMRLDRLDIIRNKKLNVVIRPDSGDRFVVLPELLRTMCRAVGTTRNSKGYEVINLNLKALWADGMNEKTVTEPFEIAKHMGIAADSIFTGSGGGIATANLDRDTDRWAFKASEYLLADGSRLDVYKDPITDPGKASKKGRFAVLKTPECGIHWINRHNDEEIPGDMLIDRYIDGKVMNATTLDEIRTRVDSQL